ncbi:hypothetical protein Bylgja_gp34 [Pelagibacter phage Bylgja EXVC010P]|nr:hypothetical protein Bylgja_gp34 [Pelagibacter phage Bylgja EXVC010P]QTD79480.1 hypothetical protein Himinglaeva_gp34 [Pelagibacter phage Himinglaeva EXVC011P]
MQQVNVLQCHVVIRRNGLQTLTMTHPQSTKKQGVNMRINFILCQLFIEKWESWSKIKVSRENGEIILDIAYWRVYLR